MRLKKGGEILAASESLVEVAEDERFASADIQIELAWQQFRHYQPRIGDEPELNSQELRKLAFFCGMRCAEELNKEKAQEIRSLPQSYSMMQFIGKALATHGFATFPCEASEDKHSMEVHALKKVFRLTIEDVTQ